MRVVSFLLINVVIMLTISLLTMPFHNFMTAAGMNYSKLMIFCAIWGFAGAFISLLMSKAIAKWTMGLQIINGTENAQTQWIYNTVAHLASIAKIPMPEVAIYEGAPNAFATGPSASNSLVAVSTGLLQTMDEEEVTAVLAHEIAHICNGDMVTTTLLQGTLNAFTMFFARIIGAVFSGKSDDGEGSNVVYFITVFVLDLVFGILASMVLAWFSRQREFRADYGAAQLMGQARSMQRALGRLKGIDGNDLPSEVRAMGISSGTLFGLFSTHPPLDERIEALNQF